MINFYCLIFKLPCSHTRPVVLVHVYMRLLGLFGGCHLLCPLSCCDTCHVSSRRSAVCCTSCASSRCPLVRARWPSVTAASPSQTTHATPTICTASSVSTSGSIYLPLLSWLNCACRGIVVCSTLQSHTFIPPTRIHAGTRP